MIQHVGTPAYNLFMLRNTLKQCSCLLNLYIIVPNQNSKTKILLQSSS